MMSYSSQSPDEWWPATGASGGLPVPDATEDEQTTNSRGKALLSPQNSCGNYADMNIEDSTKKQPAARRRSRASKRTPMVLLNASASNFRALVQQYTGCHSSPSSYKGPVNLNFGGSNEDSNDQPLSKFGIRSNNFSRTGQADSAHQQQQQLQFENIQQFFEDDHQEGFFYGGSNATDASLSTNANPATYAISSDFDNKFVNDLSGNDEFYFR